MDIDTLVTYAGYLVAILTAAVSLYKSHKAGKSFAEAMTVLVNTLKDENKMVDGKFSSATIEKAEALATTIGANDVAVEQVKSALKGKELDIKLGSLKGKPVYLSDALQVGGIIQGFSKLFKK